MKVYAVVGTSKQTIVDDRVSYSPAENEIRMKSERPVGDGYVATADGTWEIPLDSVKQEKIDSLKQIRDTKEILPIQIDKGIFDYDDKACARLSVARQGLEDANDPTLTITWTTADNQRVPMSLSDFVSINTAAMARSNQLHIQYNTLKERVKQATTIEQISAITWPENE